jgi:hypothetical protein
LKLGVVIYSPKEASINVFKEAVLPAITRTNKKFWKELICLLSLHYLKMSFAIKPAFAPT